MTQWIEHIHECTIRDFKYSQYKDMGTNMKVHTVSEKAYKLFHAAYELDMEENIGNSRADMELGIQQSLEMLDNMHNFGTIDKPV